MISKVIFLYLDGKIKKKSGGDGIRTHDFLHAMQTL